MVDRENSAERSVSDVSSQSNSGDHKASSVGNRLFNEIRDECSKVITGTENGLSKLGHEIHDHPIATTSALVVGAAALYVSKGKLAEKIVQEIAENKLGAHDIELPKLFESANRNDGRKFGTGIFNTEAKPDHLDFSKDDDTSRFKGTDLRSTASNKSDVIKVRTEEDMKLFFQDLGIAKKADSSSDTLRSVFERHREEKGAEGVLVQVARHKNTPTGVLNELTDYPHPIRSEIIGNPSATAEQLEKVRSRGLSGQELATLAGNPSASAETLNKVYVRAQYDEDEGANIYGALAQNPSSSPSQLFDMARRGIRTWELPYNPSTPKEALRILGDESAPWMIRQSVAANPNVEDELLDRLAKDEHKRVRDEALRAIDKRISTTVSE